MHQAAAKNAAADNAWPLARRMTISLLLGLLVSWPGAQARQTVEPSPPLQAKAKAKPIRSVTYVADSDFLPVDVDIGFCSRIVAIVY
jgi:hypothetical protein